MIAGIDCSSKAVHVVFLDEHENLLATYRTDTSIEKTKDMYKRLYLLGEAFAFAFVLAFSGTIAVAIETPIYINNLKSTVSIAQVVGLVSWLLHKQQIQIDHVDNRAWKKVVLGNGAATKQDIMSYAIQKWGDRFPEQDYADAACIALWEVYNTRGI